MTNREQLAAEFESHRGHLQGVAFRMLGSLSEADDAIQEAWLRLSRDGGDEVANLGGWLTTVVARVCLDMLRARKARREEALESTTMRADADPEREALMADSVGIAMLIVLDALTPPERLAFVLHDLFGVTFDEIARIVGRSPMAARQLASRARRRIQGREAASRDELVRQRELVDAFIAALRAGDFEGLVALLDPDFSVRADAVAAGGAPAPDIHGAHAWASRALAYSRGIRHAQPALVDGAVGVVVAARGKLFRILTFTFREGKIARMDVTGDPSRLAEMEVAVAPPPGGEREP
jgi:RNA polymerase sigma-70 factor (ECF subfamily)